MDKSHEELYDEFMEEQRLESVRGQQKPGTTAKAPEKTPSPSEGIQYQTLKPKKAKPVIKTARAGGYVKAADGIAKRGKTRGRFV
jgi:hypothetical protein